MTKAYNNLKRKTELLINYLTYNTHTSSIKKLRFFWNARHLSF